MTAPFETLPKTDQIVVPLSELRDAERNPNVMDQQKFDLLKQVIARAGFTQPICVRAFDSSQWEIIDGHHRVQAARELGMTQVPAVTVVCSEAEGEVLRAAMNRLRGEVDLNVMANIVRDLHDGGWRLEDMVLTGFSMDEVNDLLSASAASTADVILDQPVDTSSGDPEEEPSPRFLLEVEFLSRADMAKAKRQLRKIGKGDLAAGVMALLGEK